MFNTIQISIEQIPTIQIAVEQVIQVNKPETAVLK